MQPVDIIWTNMDDIMIKIITTHGAIDHYLTPWHSLTYNDIVIIGQCDHMVSCLWWEFLFWTVQKCDHRIDPDIYLIINYDIMIEKYDRMVRNSLLDCGKVWPWYWRGLIQFQKRPVLDNDIDTDRDVEMCRMRMMRRTMMTKRMMMGCIDNL